MVYIVHVVFFGGLLLCRDVAQLATILCGSYANCELSQRRIDNNPRQTESRNINDRKLSNILSKTFASTAAGGGSRNALFCQLKYIFVSLRLLPSLSLSPPFATLGGSSHSSAVATDFANYKLKTLNFALSRISPNEWQKQRETPRQDAAQTAQGKHIHKYTNTMCICVYISQISQHFISVSYCSP